MQLQARVGGQPPAHRLVLVGPVVVQDDVQGEVGRERAVKAPQELQKLLMSMTPVAFADHLAGQHVERGEQRRRAVALVVVGPGARAPTSGGGSDPRCSTARAQPDGSHPQVYHPAH